MPQDAMTRRTLWGFAAALGLAAGAPRGAVAADDDLGISTDAAAIHQETVFKAPPRRVYDALTDEKTFQKIVVASGAMQSMSLRAKPARISLKPGGAFSLFGGYITGRQLELEPGARIVQAWRSQSWRPHLYSVVRFQLDAHPDGTKLVFDQVGFPNEEAHSLATGWRDHYWKPLATVLAA